MIFESHKVCWTLRLREMGDKILRVIRYQILEQPDYNSKYVSTRNDYKTEFWTFEEPSMELNVEYTSPFFTFDQGNF